MTMSENSCDLKENDKLQLGGERPLKKGPWTPEEDAILLEYLKKHGQGRWNSVQKYSGLARCAKSCRLRWTNHLNPNIKKGAFTPEEEKIIVKYHAKYGNKWARMATKLPGRTDNEIKNYWHTRMKRRMKQGLPLYPDSKEENWSPEHEPNNNNNNNIINDNNYNSNYTLNNGSVSPSLRLNPNHNTPLSLSIPQHHHSPLHSPQHHHQLSPLHHHRISPSHSLASSPTQRLSLGQPFTSAYQSTLSLIDPASVAFTSFRSPPILSSPLSRFKKSEMHLITSLPLSSPSSSIGQSSSPVLQSQYKMNAFLSPSLSFSLNSELPSSPFSQTATLKPSAMELPSSQFSQRDDSGFTFDTKIDFSAYPPRKVLRSSIGTNMEFLSGQLSPRAAFNPTNASNIQLPSTRPFQTEDPKFTTAGMSFQHHSSNISPATTSNYPTGFSTEVYDKSRLFEALISPHRVGTKRKCAIFDGFSQEEEEAQAEGKHGLIDALIQELDGNVYNTNTGHDFRGESLSEKERREESSRESSGREIKNTSPAEESRGDCLMREYLKTEDLLGKSSTKDGLISESLRTEGLLTSKEPNSQLNGSDMVSRQSTNIFTRSVSIGHWNEMNSDYCPEEKEKDGPHEDEIIGMADELSSLLEYFPTTVQVPDWYRNSDEVPEDTSQGEMDINLGLEMQNASWNNFSGICQ